MNGRRGGAGIYRDIPQPLRELIEPVVDEHECELVDVEVTRPRGPGLLRIVVDSRAGDGRVPIERCAAISRELRRCSMRRISCRGRTGSRCRRRDSIGCLRGRRISRRPCRRRSGSQTRRPLDGRKRYRGRLVAFEAGVLKLNVDGDLALIPFDEVEKANTIYEFTSADFAKESRLRDSSQSGGV